MMITGASHELYYCTPMRPHLPLNALRAFEASARHLSFTRAAEELCVSQGAVSQQVKALEERLGVRLFRRLPRGLALTDEAQRLAPMLQDAFDRISGMLERLRTDAPREVLTVAAVGTFAVGWLLPRAGGFRDGHPGVDLRLLTNNNKVDLAGEGLDYAIRFGDGAWHGTEADELFAAPLSPLCAPDLAARLRAPEDLSGLVLLRSYRAEEWPAWFAAARSAAVGLAGPVFDSSQLMAQAAMRGEGVALAPPAMFAHELAEGRLVRPFQAEVRAGSYWLTRLRSRPVTGAMRSFREWLLSAAAEARR